MSKEFWEINMADRYQEKPFLAKKNLNYSLVNDYQSMLNMDMDNINNTKTHVSDDNG